MNVLKTTINAVNDNVVNVNYIGVVALVVIGVAMGHYWPDQKEYAGGMIGIGIGWLGKHLNS